MRIDETITFNVLSVQINSEAVKDKIIIDITTTPFFGVEFHLKFVYGTCTPESEKNSWFLYDYDTSVCENNELQEKVISCISQHLLSHNKLTQILSKYLASKQQLLSNFFIHMEDNFIQAEQK